jgi:hypothetical protein
MRRAAAAPRASTIGFPQASLSAHPSAIPFPASSNNLVHVVVQGLLMRQMRLVGIALVLVTAMAGGAFALGVALNASHSVDANGHAVSGAHSVALSDKGASVSSGLETGMGSVDGAASATLPQVPTLPPMPQLPSLPATPSVSGSASAAGSASASMMGASATGHGAVDVTMG